MKNLILVSGDIIENSNKYMDYGGGVCGAIYDKNDVKIIFNLFDEDTLQIYEK